MCDLPMYTLRNDRLTVTVSPHGAEMQSVLFLGKERLWQNQNGGWKKHAPLLFPVCGHCGVLVGEKAYPMPFHGFACESIFTCEEFSDTKIRLSLVDNTETREVFPYSFALYVTYRLEENSILLSYRLENPGDTPLPAFLGGHESYALSEPVQHYRLEFPFAENFLHRVHNENGYLTPHTRSFGHGRSLPLPGEHLQERRTLILSDLRSRFVRLVKENGEKVAEITYPDYPNLLLWHPDGSNMICIEPWMNLPDPADQPITEFSKKENVLLVPAKDAYTIERRITYFPSM